MRRLALVTAALLMLACACTSSESESNPTPEAPEPSPGTSFVGRSRVIAAVPLTWLADMNRRSLPRQRAECRPVVGVVIFQRGPSNCVRAPVLAILSPDSADADRLIRYLDSPLAEQVRSVDGIQVSRLDCGDGFCSFESIMVASAPDLGAILFAQGSSVQIDRLMASVQLLPEGYTTVPFIDPSLSSRAALDRLDAAGLMGDRPSDADSFPHYFLGTDPAAGSVVRLGDKVEVLIGDG